MKNSRLSLRLITAFMFMALIVAVSGVYGIVTINRVSARVQETMKSHAAQEKVVILMRSVMQESRIHLLEAAMERTDLAGFAPYRDEYLAKRDIFRSYMEILRNGNAKLGVPRTPPGGSLAQRLHDVQESWNGFEQVADELLAHKTHLLTTGKGGATDDRLHHLAMNETLKSSEKAQQAVDELLVTVGSFMNQVDLEIDEVRRGAAWTFSGGIVGASLLATFLGIMAARNIIRRLDRMVTALDQGASGDLTATVAVDSRDEIGQLGTDFNVMISHLSAMVGKVNRTSQELTSISRNIYHASKRMMDAAELQVSGVSETSCAVTEINVSITGVAKGVDRLSRSAADSSVSILEMAASVEEVAANVEQLTVSVEEVSSSIVEMAASIRQIDANIAQLVESAGTTASSVVEMDCSIGQVQNSVLETAEITRQVMNDAREGKSSVDATISGMIEIRRSSAITAEVIGTLIQRADDIGLILSVIDDVAEQTSLLALNAAIIAAQAGDQGKGFAVVADEIKEISERTSSSTREIVQLVKGVQEETRRAAGAVCLTEQSIIDGEKLSASSGAALAKIVAGVHKADSRVAEIARAAVEQAKGSRMIRESMEKVSEMVEQIARASHEQGKGSELIMTAVTRMKGLTGHVRNSTSEQSRAGALISASTEQILVMVQGIKSACDEQARGNVRIATAVHGIQQSTEVTHEAARVMDDAVVRLSRQIEVLEKEMGTFTITKKGEHRDELPQG
jgi:methyl-accepting chemotaxis protein